MAVRLSIHEALASGALDRAAGPLVVFHAQLGAVVPLEAGLVEIPLKVLLAHGMERAIDAALHDREEALRRVAVGDAAHILVPAVIYR